MMPLHIFLTPDDMTYATRIGTQRQQMQRARAPVNLARVDQTRTGLTIDIEGAKGELAFSKLTGLPWDNAFHATTDEWARSRGDVSGVEVKTTRYDPPYLKLSKRHNPDARYVSMRVVGNEAWCHGWIWGHEAQRERFWDETMPRPCYCVPPEYLYVVRAKGK